jgi:hypothetical protein
MRVSFLPIIALLSTWVPIGCGPDSTGAPASASDGAVAHVLVAPPSNLVWTSSDQVVFWAPIYQQVTVSPVRLTAVDPHTRIWRYLEPVDRHAERISMSADGATAWFVDKPHFDFQADTLSVVVRFSLTSGRADTVAVSRPVRLSGLHGYARSVIAEPQGQGALYAAPPDSLWGVAEPVGTRTLVTTGCTTIQAVSADGHRLLCFREGANDLVFVTVPGGELTPFDVRSASPSRFPQGFGFIGGSLHAVITTAADSSWSVSDWGEETGSAKLLFETSSFLEDPDLAFYSDDGARIAIWTEECLDPNFGLCLGGALARLRVIDRATGSVQIVASHHVPQGVRGSVAAFSPDDRRIAYVIQYVLYIQSID